MNFNQILRNAGAFMAGLLAGAFLNGMIIRYGHVIISPPEGLDLRTEAGLKNGMALMGPEHFIMPFLAHFLGSLAAAALAARLSNSMIPSLATGLVFLAGGIWMVFLLTSPLWFDVADLSLAYLPAALLGYRIGNRKTRQT